MTSAHARLKFLSSSDAMYEDKLDRKIDSVFFDRKSTEWRHEQDRILRSIEEHQAANQVYLEEGIRILELSQRTYKIFIKQESREERRLFNNQKATSQVKSGSFENWLPE